MVEYHGKALTDFDEAGLHFDALLPVSELMSREVDLGRLRAFVERLKRRALSSETVRYERLPQLMMQHFDVEEIRILGLDYLNLDLEHLVGPAAGLADHVETLIRYCERQDLLEDLVTGVVQERPAVSEELAVAA